MNRAARPSLAVLVATMAFTPLQVANAIVVRDDRRDADYVALGSQYPAAVSIRPDGSGALVGARFVLTAAHVARGVAGRHPRVEIDGRELMVDRVFIHPGWKGRGEHDIALLRIADRVDAIRPVGIFRGDDEIGRIVTFVGAGDTGTGLSGPETQDHKKRGATNRVDDADADWLYFTFDAGDDATELEGVSGPGDSGGPAFIEEDGELYVLGVSVFSFNGKPGRYGTREGYTRVSTHADWIESILAGTSDEAGFAPADAATAMDGDSRALVRHGASPESLANIPDGTIINAYIQAFNGGDNDGFLEFLATNATETYLGQKTQEEHVADYRRLLQEFGQITATGVVEISSDRAVIRVAGSAGFDGEFHFGFADGRIHSLMVAKIDAVRR